MWFIIRTPANEKLLCKIDFQYLFSRDELLWGPGEGGEFEYSEEDEFTAVADAIHNKSVVVITDVIEVTQLMMMSQEGPVRRVIPVNIDFEVAPVSRMATVISSVYVPNQDRIEEVINLWKESQTTEERRIVTPVLVPPKNLKF